MAINATLSATGGSGEDVRIYDIVVDADADVGPTAFAHGLPFTPQFAIVQPAEVGSYIGQYSAVVTGTTQFSVNKINAVGAAGAVPGTTVVCQIAVGRWPVDESR